MSYILYVYILYCDRGCCACALRAAAHGVYVYIITLLYIRVHMILCGHVNYIYIYIYILLEDRGGTQTADSRRREVREAWSLCTCCARPPGARPGHSRAKELVCNFLFSRGKLETPEFSEITTQANNLYRNRNDQTRPDQREITIYIYILEMLLFCSSGPFWCTVCCL